MNEDKATKYHRLRRRTEVVSLAWSVVLLAVLGFTPASRWLRDLAESGVAGLPPGFGSLGSTAAFLAMLMALSEVGGLPIAFYGFLVERRFGLSNETVREWAFDEVKSAAIGLLLGIMAAMVLYAFLRAWPAHWWIPAGVTFAALVAVMAHLAPVLLLPLFYSVKPLDRDTLRQRLMRLAERAGSRVVGVYEWGLAAKTKKANAALAGWGRTRRILVTDTMLSAYSDEEIEVVLAHELAHHVHGDIWKGLALQSVLILAGFFAAAQALDWLVPVVGLRGPGDLAGLPVLLLSAGAVSLLALPFANALSRAHERKADQFALRLTGNSGAFVAAMRRLAAQNLAEESPSKVVEWLFHSHPPIHERIAFAQTFKDKVTAES